MEIAVLLFFSVLIFQHVECTTRSLHFHSELDSSLVDSNQNAGGIVYQTDSYRDCLYRCMKYKNSRSCISAAYDSTSGDCELFENSPIDENVSVVQKNGATLYFSPEGPPGAISDFMVTSPINVSVDYMTLAWKVAGNKYQQQTIELYRKLSGDSDWQIQQTYSQAAGEPTVSYTETISIIEAVAYDFKLVGTVDREDRVNTVTTNITNVGVNLVTFDTARFTNLGATGREGPTSIGNHYDGKEHEGLVTLSGGIQYFNIPASGQYIIEAVGAAGGCDSYGCNYRSYGAYMKGTFTLAAGTQLKILVGQAGGTNSYSSTGGGGGTFVTLSDNTPLIVAGGGGGVESPNTRHATCSASTGTSGNNGYAGSAWPGGTDGNGATTADSSNSGGGGGGLLTDGRSSSQYGGSYGTGGEGGKAFVNGGVGGRSKYYGSAGYDADGGFGGGAGAYGNGGGAGGGGGYSGGACGDNNGQSCGGGGGSYNDGSNQSNVADYNDSHGYVILTYAS